MNIAKRLKTRVNYPRHLSTFTGENVNGMPTVWVVISRGEFRNHILTVGRLPYVNGGFYTILK